MELHDRIKYLRKSILNITQEEFALKINISRAQFTSIEINRTKITNRVISDICEKFNVSEKWLREGIGEPLIETEESYLNSLAEKFEIDDFLKSLVESYLELDEAEKFTIQKFFGFTKSKQK